MIDKELEFSNKVNHLANEVRNDVNEEEFAWPSCGGKAILKISGERRQEVWGYCENCKSGVKERIYN